MIGVWEGLGGESMTMTTVCKNYAQPTNFHYGNQADYSTIQYNIIQ